TRHTTNRSTGSPTARRSTTASSRASPWGSSTANTIPSRRSASSRPRRRAFTICASQRRGARSRASRRLLSSRPVHRLRINDRIGSTIGLPGISGGFCMPQANGVYESVVDLIGGTPLVRIRKFEGLDRVRLYAKLEFFNPGGSVKDRIGPHMIRAAESQGKLRPGGTIIEPTAGNTGIGLALAALEKGYRVILVVPEHFSQEKQALMKALGAEIVNTPREKGMAGAIEKAKELAAQIENSFIPQQFANPANPQAHSDTTGPEIYEQLDGRIDIFVAGVGTGGTLTGTARYLKEKIPGLRAVAVEPEGSILCGGQPGPHRTEGIGVEFIPETLDTRLIDKV